MASHEQVPVQIPKQRRHSFMDYGGANSLSNFASSYSRAQNYSGTLLLEQHDEECRDVLTQQRQASFSSGLFQDEEDEEVAIVDDEFPSTRKLHGSNHIGNLLLQNEECLDQDISESVLDEMAPLIPTISKQSSHVVFSKLGSSTAPQTIFNSINTLVGIGMLSLPLGFRMSGWLLGVIFLLGSAISTNLTAKYLGRILRNHPNLMTYGDIAYAYGGRLFSILVTGFFVLDLLGASLSLIILFADCFVIVWPHVKSLKLIIVSIVFCSSLLPLHVLSIFSLLGILGTIGIISVIITCGFLLRQSPGSLLDFAPTDVYPKSLPNLLFSLGVFMAPWGGHPVFPELFRDMRHPKKFSNTSNVSFSVTFLLDFTIGATGYLMYGKMVDDSIVKSIMQNSNYPEWVNKSLCLLMGILPVSKLPLVTRPIITSYEKLLGLSPCKNKQSRTGTRTGTRTRTRTTLTILRIFSRFIFCGVLLLFALLFTSFGKLVSFLGSAICYTVCLAFPLMFYLKLNRSSVSKFQSHLIRLGICISILLALLGSYASIAVRIT
ncbi:hypothetical protein KGF56_000781 [Candida oxycetoniae]|uniref:Amino acid transporter transmembrane domain-containing protein n=1 Tax=Candida oxycetoniae TaxID=497107 RepID=A0AAI9T140_9ASCO|nr:uncharacterized protein KGF56_000781 [Candida oxycetoniae]KAI3406301.2 hypothetical protein KGF56_000781 [Candida oxycetoniae]